MGLASFTEFIQFVLILEILAKKIENKCWWCKSDKCVIVNVDDTEVIKNYSDAAVAQEEEEKKKNNNDSK
jgi:hypothetical protein